MPNKSRTIIDMNNDEAKQFLMKPESYSSLDLPSYFDFEYMLSIVETFLDIQDIDTKKARDNEGVNYHIYTNKDGRYSWRNIQLINPVLYVKLVNEITKKDKWGTIVKRMNEFRSIEKVKCVSIPRESNIKSNDLSSTILNWWNSFEQETIKMSLKFNHVLVTDISDCYGSIYTHTIPWAIHTKEVAKRERHSNDLIGNIIDKSISGMQYSQTNGIPQGSVLMDFIAEIILGYADEQIYKKIKEYYKEDEEIDYYILRYRDDYKIFSNKYSELEQIGKIASEVLQGLNFNLNSSKTFMSNDIIDTAIKTDKKEWSKLRRLEDFHISDDLEKDKTTYHQKYLLQIYNFSKSNPNSGLINSALSSYSKLLRSLNNEPSDTHQSIAIIIAIIINNPKAITTGSEAISLILRLIKDEELKKEIARNILNKTKNVPNSKYFNIWIYRILYQIIPDEIDSSKLSKDLFEEVTNIWDFSWIDKENELYKDLLKTKIVEEKTLEDISSEITTEESEKFSWFYFKYFF